jgi:photosystem II stability/assembly factor-like uncharacterized protein
MRILLGTLSLALVVPLGAAAASARPVHDLTWDETVVNPDQSFRGLDAVDRDTAWLAGGSMTEGGPGQVWRTTDGGATWEDVSPPETDGLSLRDVEARDGDTAVVLAIGPGEASRVYRTDDGGETWDETFRNAEPTAFYNCMDFYPGGKRGLVVSDPVDGKFRVAATSDGGRSWEVLPDAGMPDSTGEYNFSASGDCLVTAGRTAWFGSGGEEANVYRSTDRGLTWKKSPSTIPAGESAGVFGLAFKNPRQGVAVGGDFAAPADGTDASAVTRDGTSWTNGGDLDRLAEDAAWLPGARSSLVAVGESGDVAGSYVSHDGGRTWTTFSDVGYHALDCTRDGSCWAAGGDGRAARLTR